MLSMTTSRDFTMIFKIKKVRSVLTFLIVFAFFQMMQLESFETAHDFRLQG